MLEVGFWDHLSPSDGLLIVATRRDRGVVTIADEMKGWGGLFADMLSGWDAQGGILKQRPKVVGLVVNGLAGTSIGLFTQLGVTYEWVLAFRGRRHSVGGSRKRQLIRPISVRHITWSHVPAR